MYPQLLAFLKKIENSFTTCVQPTVMVEQNPFGESNGELIVSYECRSFAQAQRLDMDLKYYVANWIDRENQAGEPFFMGSDSQNLSRMPIEQLHRVPP